MSNAWNWSDRFHCAVEALSPHGNPLVHRFWVLFVSGQSFGEGAWFWVRSFRHLYILHLLVLSGSQIESLTKWLRSMHSRLWVGAMSHGGCSRGRSRSLQAWISMGLLAFAHATDWSAPITRATLIAVLGIWLVRWPSRWVLPLGFALQWGLFAAHRHQMGFYLSWIAYLVVVGAGSLKISRTLSTIVVSSLLFLIVDIGYFENSFQIEAFLLCLASNFLFCAFFEWALMPVGAVMILASMLLSLAGYWNLGCEQCGKFLALWTRPLGQALLVVLKWLMYT